VRVRIPAIDAHALRRLYKGFYLDGRALVQIVQNHYSIGARWAAPLNQRYVGGQKRYLSECDPEQRADIVIGYNDLREPQILKWQLV